MSLSQQAGRPIARRRSRSRRIGSTALLFALVSVAMAPACAADAGDSPSLAVSVVSAERRCVKDLLQASGLLVPKAEIEVRADRAGLLIGRVLVEPGDTVATGQVLARLVQDAGAPAQTVAIRSPAAGTVLGVSAMVGNVASPESNDPLFRIIPDGTLELKGEILAPSLPRVRIGQPVALEVVGVGRLNGTVASIDKSVDEITQLGTVRVALPSDPRLRPGVYARAALDTGEICEVMVPLTAVLFDAKGPVVQIVRGNRIETRGVELGGFDNGLIQLRKAVEPGETVVRRAGAFVQEGDRVTPVPFEAALP